MTTPETGGAQEATAATQQTGQESSAATGQQTEPQTPEGTPGQEPGQTPEGQTPPDLSAITDPTLRSYVEAQLRDTAAARREAATYRTRAQAAEGKVQEYERANETAEQAAQRERDELAAERDRLAAEVQNLRVGTVVKAAASTAFDPDLVFSMIREQVTVNDQGEPQNVQALVDDLKRDKPFLFRRTDAGAGGGAGAEGSPPAAGMNDWIRGRATGAVR